MVGVVEGFPSVKKIIGNVLLVLKATNHASAQVLRSMFSECADPLGDSTMMYKLVSSANKKIEQPTFLTMSIYR